MSRKSHDYLYVVMDCFSNMCILMPCKKQISTEHTASLFFQYVWVCFGLPTSIVSNRDSRFLMEFWTSLWKMMDTKLKINMKFHPQIDRQIEVVNRTMVHLLRGYCGKHPNLRDEHPPYVQHSYNRAVHSSTQHSPFETCFGYPPKDPSDMVFGREDGSSGCNDRDKA